ncbi:MAG: hypothetical protein SFZ03_03665 [Candidatus Melainabacteria bacterium]|nr:hypothetical protein [Candidatus Melainabacteria bacterium]
MAVNPFQLQTAANPAAVQGVLFLVDRNGPARPFVSVNEGNPYEMDSFQRRCPVCQDLIRFNGVGRMLSCRCEHNAPWN